MNMPENRVDNSKDKLLNRDEISKAIELLFQRMETLDKHCENGFPVFSPKDSDQWLISKGGSWVGGFWAAEWWLKAQITQAENDRNKAAAISQRLQGRLNDDSINRSMVFHYGAALGAQWFDDNEAKNLVSKSIETIIASYNAEIKAIPLGTAMGGGKEGNQIINIDSLAAVIQLLSRSEQDEHQIILKNHVDTLLSTLGNDNGAFHAHAHFKGGSFETLGEAGDWSRGQAWAMLGLVRAAERWGEPYLSLAIKACEYWLRSRPNAFPANKLTKPEALCDVSATVIASLAMLSLAELAPHGESWRNDAHQQISAIIHSAYFNDETGIFWGCCYKTRTEEELVESTWGSFLLMSALCLFSDDIKV